MFDKERSSKLWNASLPPPWSWLWEKGALYVLVQDEEAEAQLGF
jgi:hypothetical protein